VGLAPLGPQSKPWPPLWGSDEHREWLQGRLERNLRWRRSADDFAALGESTHRRTARELVDRLAS
jgi:hypothetical protein